MSSERGSALTESILLGLVLLVPVIWLLGTLSVIHAAALASTAAARDAGALAAEAGDPSTARSLATASAATIFEAHGLETDRLHLGMDLPERLSRGSAVIVEISYPVKVFALPFFGEIAGPTILVHSKHVARVEPYASH